MSDTAELRAPQTGSSPSQDEQDRQSILRALRIAHVRLKLILLEVEDIAAELKDGRLTPTEAMRACMIARIDALFPRELDGA